MQTSTKPTMVSIYVNVGLKNSKYEPDACSTSGVREFF